MNAIAAKIVAGVIVALALLAAVSYVRGLRAELADRSHQLETAAQGVADRDDTIKRLQHDAADKAKQQAQLDHTQGAIAAKLTATQQENRRLMNENAELRKWSDTPLPADIVRMQSSPAYTGANDYLEPVSASDTVHAADADPAH